MRVVVWVAGWLGGIWLRRWGVRDHHNAFTELGALFGGCLGCIASEKETQTTRPRDVLVWCTKGHCLVVVISADSIECTEGYYSGH